MRNNITWETLYQEAKREFEAQNYRNAVSLLEEGLDLASDSLNYLQLLGGAYQANGQVMEAEQVFLQIHDIEPSFGSQFNLAECAFVRGDYALAQEEFKRALSMAPAEPIHRSIAAFKVIVSAGLAGSPIPDCYDQEFTDTGSHYNQLVHSIWDNDLERAHELIESPQTNSSDAGPYIDTLRTSGMIQDA
ncbi:Tetratricopeptide repeat-containing protein [Rubritalea squalenifaciens DSM 18772]|uniref:Tetratricopeptide repeat-containing protein n=1 Tax=Rubritalea squalenifaciens DSM 18772 TaxID=1123071 RepID=A0A1M6C0Z7_9BACT|nr:tetratricopeptide repeat protein [Rubritalea squalenifaciens]SHI54667.1 Tetratricopeptide repeat-containing protein [Rubritalea squalenifaciens DSM 18772]